MSPYRPLKPILLQGSRLRTTPSYIPKSLLHVQYPGELKVNLWIIVPHTPKKAKIDLLYCLALKPQRSHTQPGC